MSRAGLALALLIAVYAALLYAPLFFKASDYLRGHRADRDGFTLSDDVEATDREIRRTGAWAVSDFDHLNLLPVLSAGSEKQG